MPQSLCPTGYGSPEWSTRQPHRGWRGVAEAGNELSFVTDARSEKCNLLSPTEVDHLQLRGAPHQRWRYSQPDHLQADGTWCAIALNP